MTTVAEVPTIDQPIRTPSVYGPYVPEWARPTSPTRTMTEQDARAYYKANAVRSDCLFTLEHQTMPADLLFAWATLLDAVYIAGKETPAHRQTRDELRRAGRLHLDGRPYQLPEQTVGSVKRGKIRPVCPHCGR